MSNAYTVLGVEPGDSQERIARAHKLLVRLHHPDQGGDAAKMARVNKAWAKIGTPEARKEYDAHLATLGGKSASPSDALPTDALFDMLKQAGLPAEHAAEAKRLTDQGSDVIRGIGEFVARFRAQ